MSGASEQAPEQANRDWREIHGAELKARRTARETVPALVAWLSAQGWTVSPSRLTRWFDEQGVRKPVKLRPAHLPGPRSPLADHAALIADMKSKGANRTQIAEALAREGLTIGASALSNWMYRNVTRPGGRAARLQDGDIRAIAAVMADGRARTLTDILVKLNATGWSGSTSTKATRLSRVRVAVRLLMLRGGLVADPHTAGFPTIYSTPPDRRQG